jgi:hypothetical protein
MGQLHQGGWGAETHEHCAPRQPKKWGEWGGGRAVCGSVCSHPGQSEKVGWSRCSSTSAAVSSPRPVRWDALLRGAGGVSRAHPGQIEVGSVIISCVCVCVWGGVALTPGSQRKVDRRRCSRTSAAESSPSCLRPSIQALTQGGRCSCGGPGGGWNGAHGAPFCKSCAGSAQR